MGRSKIIKISDTDTRRIKLGTIDKCDPKSFYITISSWVKPQQNIDAKKLISILRVKLKTMLGNSSMNYDTFIDLDLRESGLRMGKKSFMSCEMTFLNNDLNFNGDAMQELVHNLLIKLDNNIIADNEFLEFTATK